MDAETLSNAFISLRLEFCNALFCGLPNYTKSGAARILTTTTRFEHIIPILSSLDWLPITARSDLKVLVYYLPIKPSVV